MYSNTVTTERVRNKSTEKLGFTPKTFWILVQTLLPLSHLDPWQRSGRQAALRRGLSQIPTDSHSLSCHCIAVHTLSSHWCLQAFHRKKCCLLSSNRAKWAVKKKVVTVTADEEKYDKTNWSKSNHLCYPNKFTLYVPSPYRHGDLTFITTVTHTKNLVFMHTKLGISLLCIKQCSPSVHSKWVYAVHSNTFITMVTKQLFATFVANGNE